MATQDGIGTMGLSFPAQTFQKLSPSSYLLRHLQFEKPTRPSGRAPEAFRMPTLHPNALSHAHGSAVIRSGDTAVVCGVRGEILGLTHGEGRMKGRIMVQRNAEETGAFEDEDGEITTHGLLVPNLELGIVTNARSRGSACLLTMSKEPGAPVITIQDHRPISLNQ